ncbi:MAG: phospholipid carrier-dependent glycosyltransferase [Thermodesulfovibrionia bacterium]|nr:phospholipid carrier-dependent glycosyltransferase [Thermodesulfovibrionia bacterium]
MNKALSNDSLFVNSWKLALLILILAAVLRLWGAFELNEYIEDEAIHVPNAISLGTYGTTDNWNWQHPQLSGLIMYGTILIFGDNPVGWRSSNIFFGTASVALIFLIGSLLYPGSAVPLISTALLAFDPYHIYLSRTTFMEIPVTFFFLLYLYLLLEYTENKRPVLPLAGIAMGLTMALKAYFVFAIPLVVMYALYRIRQRGELTRPVITDFTVSLLLLPFAVYLLSYSQWFGRGYTFFEFIQMKMDAVWGLQRMSTFVNNAFLEAGGKPWEWFIKPMFWGHQRLLNNEEGVFLLQSNNPPFRLLVLPSLFAASVYAWKKHLSRELLTPLLFGSCYLLVLVAQRPMFSYSSIALLPFAYLALARAVTLCAIKMKKEIVVYTCFLSATLIWGVYMFPLVSARLVPLVPFRPILSMVRYMGNF